MTSTQTFYADAVLFDMDGTLTDSISAVEAAWGKVAEDIGQDKEYVIAATHGKRAIDNLRHLKPYLAEVSNDGMDVHVQEFEESILFFADAYNTHGPGSRRGSMSSSRAPSFSNSFDTTPAETPSLTPGSSAPSSRASSFAGSPVHRPSFGARLGSLLRMTGMSDVPEDSEIHIVDSETFYDDDMVEERNMTLTKEPMNLKYPAGFNEWQISACAVDRSVRILPGVKKMIESIPEGRYAVATSGAKTYAYGCMTRVGITPPKVTITADDRRLKAGKPAPDPFLLAADCLGYDAKRCVVFEDSPSGIRAGVASGATVIAVCTSHPREKIENCGAHYLVENMESVKCSFDEKDGSLKFEVKC